MAEKKKVTPEGLRQLENELQELIVVRRPEIAEKLKEAREQGDLSENAEWDAAKDEQRDVEARIEYLENLLKNIEVIDDEDSTADMVDFGSKVRFLDLTKNKELEYKIVGSTESNVLKGLISNESPLGQALLRKKVGDIAIVEAPGGTFEYKILEINKK